MCSFLLTIDGVNSPVIIPSEEAVRKLESIDGPMRIYYWYEGASCGKGKTLPVVGAEFARDRLFVPIERTKENALLCLYSLKQWSFEYMVSELRSETSLQKSINELLKTSSKVETLSAVSFFRDFLAERGSDSLLGTYVEMCNREYRWLDELSEGFNREITVEQFFDQNLPSCFECIKKAQLVKKYALLQNVEGYFLIERGVEKALATGEQKINIVFLLPNDEWQYYQNFSKDCECFKNMLFSRFGEKLNGKCIDVRFIFFRYGDDLNARPYRSLRGEKDVIPSQIGRFLPLAIFTPSPPIEKLQI